MLLLNGRHLSLTLQTRLQSNIDPSALFEAKPLITVTEAIINNEMSRKRSILFFFFFWWRILNFPNRALEYLRVFMV